MLGQTLKGRAGVYTITKQLHGSVWLATSQKNQKVVVKGADNHHLRKERNILRRFQVKSNLIRPLLDEVEDNSTPAIVLRHLDDNVHHASVNKRLTRQEVKYIARKVLEALSVLHEEGFVHTDVNPSNVLVNCEQDSSGGSRFTEVQLAGFGSAVHVDSGHARKGAPIGTPAFRSPEAHLSIRWGPATDIWSFGAMVVELLDGEAARASEPDGKARQNCGPFHESYLDTADNARLDAMIWILENCPPDSLKSFLFTARREISHGDKEFVSKIMKLDPRDRPSAHRLLEDQWFYQT